MNEYLDILKLVTERLEQKQIKYMISHVGWATSFCCPPLFYDSETESCSHVGWATWVQRHFFNEEGGQKKDFAHPTRLMKINAIIRLKSSLLCILLCLPECYILGVVCITHKLRRAMILGN
ncbi:hypothetical protein QUF54_03925 [Candidatus Marithioploca araucensis]|uniref:Uncharacterized protein n=1 Tax=Candidatus Marithioploca araucensis TaxID=70273 RepID=A0ABT7VS33_9GAMM|nr:hypothetical protein [Candidatus Marithioploca araucensis]